MARSRRRRPQDIENAHRLDMLLDVVDPHDVGAAHDAECIRRERAGQTRHRRRFRLKQPPDEGFARQAEQHRVAEGLEARQRRDGFAR